MKSPILSLLLFAASATLALADTKLSSLPVATTAAGTDEVLVITTPGSTPADQLMTLSNFGLSLLPTISGQSGKFLTNNGTAFSWGFPPWSSLTGTPTTLSGYGITDAASLTGSQTLTNKTISGGANTLTNVEPDIASGWTVNFDAADITGLADGANFAGWTDRSANGYSFSAPGSNIPTFQAGGINGYPAVHFWSTGSAGANVISTGSIWSSQSMSSGVCVVLVLRMNSYSPTSNLPLAMIGAAGSSGSAENANGLAMEWWHHTTADIAASTLNPEIQWHWNQSGSNAGGAASKDRTMNRDMVMVYNYDPVSGRTGLYVDGLCMDTQTSATTSIPASPVLNGGITLGELFTGYQQYVDFSVAKVLVYPAALTESQIRSTSNALYRRIIRDGRPWVVGFGDSIGSCESSYNQTLYDLLAAQFPQARFYNSARGGKTFDSSGAAVSFDYQAATGNLPYREMYNLAPPGSLAILWPGSIDVAGSVAASTISLSTLETDHTSIVTDLHAAGFKVLQPTMIPKISPNQSSSDTNRGNYNTWIKALTSGAEYSVDLAGLTAFNASTSTDATHGVNNFTNYATQQQTVAGANASSSTQSVTLSGAVVGEAISAAVDTSNSNADVHSDFETTVSVAGHIQQTAANLSGHNILVTFANGSHPTITGYTAMQPLFASTLSTALMNGPTGTPAQGALAYYGANGWTLLAPSTSGYILQTNGASENPSWVANTGGTSYTFSSPLSLTGSAVSLGTVPFSSGGSVALYANMASSFTATGTTLANVSCSVTIPAAGTYTFVLNGDYGDSVDNSTGHNLGLDFGGSTVSYAVKALENVTGGYQNTNWWSPYPGSATSFHKTVNAYASQQYAGVLWQGTLTTSGAVTVNVQLADGATSGSNHCTLHDCSLTLIRVQ